MLRTDLPNLSLCSSAQHFPSLWRPIAIEEPTDQQQTMTICDQTLRHTYNDVNGNTEKKCKLHFVQRRLRFVQSRSFGRQFSLQLSNFFTSTNRIVRIVTSRNISFSHTLKERLYGDFRASFNASNNFSVFSFSAMYNNCAFSDSLCS